MSIPSLLLVFGIWAICAYMWRTVLNEEIFIVSECCDTIVVQGEGGAVEKQPVIFHTYAQESDLVNGHKHFTSQDGTMALTYNTDYKQWYLQAADKR